VPTFVLYPLALIGLVTALAFVALLLLVLVEHRNRTSSPDGAAAHRRTRDRRTQGSTLL
jgi:hypothetical protein